jgi:hypothetical protein
MQCQVPETADSGAPARAARTHRPGRSSVGAQMITACARPIAVSARDTAAPEMATGIADGSESHAATSRSSRSEASTPSASGTCGWAQPSNATSITTTSFPSVSANTYGRAARKHRPPASVSASR